MMYFLLEAASRAFAKAARVLRAASTRFEPADLQSRKVIASTQYDMAAGGNEKYYGDQYWGIILPHLELTPSNAKVLDLGCGQGRLSLRLARRFPQGSVSGCDISESAIQQATEYGRSQANLEYHVQRIDAFIATIPDQSIDVVVMTEVTFFFPAWRESIPQVRKCLKAGGLLIMSFRSQYFYALSTVRSRFWSDIPAIVDQRAARIGGGMTELTWQTSAEVRALLEDDYEMDVLDIAGVGACSGISGDPHDEICQPVQLDEAEKKSLLAIETAVARSVPDAGRYILTVARKPVK